MQTISIMTNLNFDTMNAQTMALTMMEMTSPQSFWINCLDLFICFEVEDKDLPLIPELCLQMYLKWPAYCLRSLKDLLSDK